MADDGIGIPAGSDEQLFEPFVKLNRARGHGVGYGIGLTVSDLIARMGYKTQGYRDLYSADFHIGKTAYADVEEYRRRSPSWNTEKYDGTPLLIHTTTNDGDVNVLEVERLIQALKAEGKKGFTYKVYDRAPGGHSFNRLDTKLAQESRREIWRRLLGRGTGPLGFIKVRDLIAGTMTRTPN